MDMQPTQLPDLLNLKKFAGKRQKPKKRNLDKLKLKKILDLPK